ncbi:uncharacterized protein HKW66_Vig0221750 [Vigna angularis]|uniref:Uncharacterized protein n=1 Tax=Phaseolus angularis TaxID=3914 RepID=A0A8T0K132_PHAAN|nr:uncharacterized protein HKW66_Vig0221750 [Vigna angularis]
MERERVQCVVKVTCDGKVGGEVHVREVNLVMEEDESGYGGHRWTTAEWEGGCGDSAKRDGVWSEEERQAQGPFRISLLNNSFHRRTLLPSSGNTVRAHIPVFSATWKTERGT